MRALVGALIGLCSKLPFTGMFDFDYGNCTDLLLRKFGPLLL